jgi:methyl-accepting chemotaxis protein
MSSNDRWHSDNLYNCSTIASMVDSNMIGGGESNKESNDIKSVMKKNRELKAELEECKEELSKLKLQLKTLISNN